MKRIADMALGFFLLACALPCGWFSFMVSRNVLLNLRLPPNQRMTGYGFGRWEFSGWEMYVFPLVCIAVTILLATAGSWLTFRRLSADSEQ